MGSDNNSNDIASFLSEVSFFSEVSKEALQHLCTLTSTEVYRKHDTIFQKGDVGHAMYVILDGKVKVHDNHHVFGFLDKADCFGEYALIDNQERSASITVEERTTVLKIERDAFVSLMSTDSGFSQGILAVMIKRHRELDAYQEELSSSQKAIALANAKMNGLINGAMDAIIMFDSNFKIVLTNASANLLLENEDPIQRNLLFFLDEQAAILIENTIASAEETPKNINNYLPQIIKTIGSNGSEVLNEATISQFNDDDKPFYILILRNIEERIHAEDTISQLTHKTQYLEEQLNALTNNYGIIAEDITMKSMLSLIDQVSNTNATVLITGETGTGKELVSRAIHNSSDRSHEPFVRINCGAIPANLIESELFGHKKGAFTGATTDRKGRFAMADNGSIFLDEIGELPIELQPKLLRVIQEGEFEPIGSSETVKVDVRIIAATHRDLLQFSRDGKFREDLYYRLNVFPINVPALRDRGNDIILIAETLLQQFSKKLGKQVQPLSDADKALLNTYHWPGNVRELQNLIERAVITSNNGTINWHKIIPQDIANNKQESLKRIEHILTYQDISTIEKNNILKALKQTKWKISGDNGAAKLLNIPPTTLASKLKVLGIERPV